MWILWIYNGYDSNKRLSEALQAQRGGPFSRGFSIESFVNKLLTPNALPVKDSSHLSGHSMNCRIKRVLFLRQKVQFGLRESLVILRDLVWS